MSDILSPPAHQAANGDPTKADMTAANLVAAHMAGHKLWGNKVSFLMIHSDFNFRALGNCTRDHDDLPHIQPEIQTNPFPAKKIPVALRFPFQVNA